MSGYLLDTHTLLWAFEGDSDLSRRAGRLVEDSANDVVISIVVYWELQIKQTIGKLRVAREYNERLWEWFDACGFTRLGLQRSHCDRYRALPLHHRDPFDRMLIAQAQVEGFAILTADPRFKKYDVKVVW
ncbi:MAG: PIN domain nuclease [Verrucomicrobia bacterium]|nr:MAG: PIN domain nuclease [Verrucomicrobiota bacterium]PYK18225.1 MAG: PIN domain nuclease [Verrucomicrobiota bacterium]